MENQSFCFCCKFYFVFWIVDFKIWPTLYEMQISQPQTSFSLLNLTFLHLIILRMMIICFDDDNLLRNMMMVTLKEPGLTFHFRNCTTYLLELKERLSREMICIRCPYVISRVTSGFIHWAPILHANALVSPDGVSPYSLYQPTIFLWLPHHLWIMILF